MIEEGVVDEVEEEEEEEEEEGVVDEVEEEEEEEEEGVVEDKVEEGGGEGWGNKKVESKGRDGERLSLRVLNRKR